MAYTADPDGVATRHASRPHESSAADDPLELRSWIRLTLEPAINGAQRRQLLSAFGLPQAIFEAPMRALALHIGPEGAAILKQAPDSAREKAIDHTLAWLGQPGHSMLTLADRRYPRSLLDLSDPPPVLFTHGQLDCLTRPAIAIVGARSATPAGLENAQAFAQSLAARGWCIVSGLASGIDAAAHQGALAAGADGAGTLAVLGTGINRVYPASHRPLANQIAHAGLLLSEFPLDAAALPFHFPQRNRLVAALSQGVLVVEAANRSGSLITARLATELGREVFAIPGSIHSPLSRGCHALIRQGAKLVESAQDILEELSQRSLPGLPAGYARSTRHVTGNARTSLEPSDRPQHESASRPQNEPACGPRDGRTRVPQGGPAHAPQDGPAFGLQDSVLLDALGHDPVDLDTLQARTRREIGDLMRSLTLLELGGDIARQADGRYQRQR